MYIYHFFSAALIGFVIYTPFLKAADVPAVVEDHASSQQDSAILAKIKKLVKEDKRLKKLLDRSADIEEFVIKIVDFTNREIDSTTSEQLEVMLEIFKVLDKNHQALPEKEPSSRNRSGKPKYSKIYKVATKKAIKDAMITIGKQIKKLQEQRS